MWSSGSLPHTCNEKFYFVQSFSSTCKSLNKILLKSMLESEETEHLKRVLRFTNFFIASSFTHSDPVTSISISSQPCFNGGILLRIQNVTILTPIVILFNRAGV